jgi:hypothetical protein
MPMILPAFFASEPRLAGSFTPHHSVRPLWGVRHVVVLTPIGLKIQSSAEHGASPRLVWSSLGWGRVEGKVAGLAVADHRCACRMRRS